MAALATLSSAPAAALEIGRLRKITQVHTAESDEELQCERPLLGLARSAQRAAGFLTLRGICVESDAGSGAGVQQNSGSE